MSTISVDVGGTHTDLYARFGENAVHEKVPTTSEDPTEGVMNALKSANVEIEQVETLMHGSTIATNAVIEGKYPTTPFIMTEGFRDLIEIGRYHREKLYDPYQTEPEPLTAREYRYTVPGRVDETGTETEPADLQAQFEQLEEEVYDMFSAEDVESEEVDVTRIAEMRYIGQTYEVDVPVKGGSLDETTIDELVTRFQQRHEQEYGIASDEFPVTFVNLRVTGKTETDDGEFQSPTPEAASADDTETRDVYFDGEWHETAVLRQAGLDPGMDFQGPAIVTGAHSTVTLPPGMSASVDSHGNITITTSDRRNL